MTGLRLSAYLMAADPWWLADSLRSYYDLVERIVVSYDRNKRSWTGTPIPVDDCLDVIRALDGDRKCTFLAGDYCLANDPLVNDTYQRQCALDKAGRGADWVVQLDTDEVLERPDIFLSCLEEAQRRAADGMEFPARWLYSAVPPDRLLSNRSDGSAHWFLERSRRFWAISATYPGPVAIRSGSELRLCRQADVNLFRVDYSPHNTDMAHPLDTVVHRVIGRREGIIHYSWVRDEEYMRRKAGWSGHAENYSEPKRLRSWRARRKHPWRTALMTPFRSEDHRFRLVSLPWSSAPNGRERGLLDDVNSVTPRQVQVPESDNPTRKRRRGE